jgi:hypothetical protein
MILHAIILIISALFILAGLWLVWNVTAQALEEFRKEQS